MGVVYEAFDRERHLHVALKALPKSDPQALYRFKQEFRLLADITHPNLATLYELIASDDDWFITMEVIDGVDFLRHVRGLRTVATTSGSAPTAMSGFDTDRLAVTPAPMTGEPGPDEEGAPLVDFDRLRAALRQLVSALLTLHQRRRLHCDIKPSNVLVTGEGRVVVLDFGLALEFGGGVKSDAESMGVYGTVGYMAPEQASGGTLSPASDWYAVGVMLYEALTGLRPFRGTPRDVLLAKQSSTPAAPRAINPRVPEALSDLCLRLLLPAPTDRPDGVALLSAVGETAIPAAGRPFADETLLVGRGVHLDTLRAALEGTSAGRAGCVLVHAPSGVGKSALLEHFGAEVSRRARALVLTGRCFEQESVQYKALDSLVDALSRHLGHLPAATLEAVLPADIGLLARMFPVLQRVPHVDRQTGPAGEIMSRQELRDRATQALRQLLRALSARLPLVICLDDLQWGDADSATILIGALAAPDPPPVLWICAYRREYAATSPCLRALLGASGEAHDRIDLPIDELEPAEAEQLAARLLGGTVAYGPAMAARIAQESGGNPYFVQALVEHVRAEAQFASTDVLAEGIALDEVLRRRVSRLRPAARRLLEIVALAGRPLRERDAFTAADLDARDPALLNALRQGHLIRSGGDDQTIETYHDRIREAVVAQLPAANVPVLHRRLASTLEARGGADPEWVGAHFDGAGEPAHAARYYMQAADVAASVLAFDRAAELYGRSLDRDAGDRWARQSLRVKRADALANAGRSLLAAEVYRAAAKEASGADALELGRKAGYQLCIGGSIEAGRKLLEGNLKRVGVELPRSARRAIPSLLWNQLRLRWLERRGHLRHRATPVPPDRDALERLDVIWAAAAALADVDVMVAASLQARHLIEALRVQEPNRLAAGLAMYVRSVAHEGSGSRQRAIRLLEVARQSVDVVGTPYARAMFCIAQQVIHTSDRRWDEAIACLDTAEDLLRRQCTGVYWELSLLHMSRLAVLRTKGDQPAIERFAGGVLAEARQRGDIFTQARLGILVEPDALLYSDRPHEARVAVRRIRRQWLRGHFPAQLMLAGATDFILDLYLGHGWTAYRRIERYWPFLKRSLFLRVEVVRSFALQYRAAAALAASEERPADKARLFRCAKRDIARLERERDETWQIAANTLRAAIACHEGDRDRTLALLERSRLWCEREQVLAQATAIRRYQALIRGGADAPAILAETEAWLKAAGMRDPARLTSLNLMGFPRALVERNNSR